MSCIEPKAWSDDEINDLVNLREAQEFGWKEIAVILDRTPESCRNKYRDLNAKSDMKKRAVPLTSSPFPKYNEPLLMEGDALIIGDMEFPYHNADFINRCIDLALLWGINQMIAAGDTFHFDSLSTWEVQWKGYHVPQDLEEQFNTFFNSLPPEYQMRGHDILTEYAINAQGNTDLGQEINIVNRAVRALESAFDRIDFVMGNHENRLIRALKSPIFTTDLLSLVEADKKVWNIKPYFFSLLKSGDREFQIEHPRSAAKYTAEKLASKFQRNIIMGHSHLLSFGFDISGKLYAIHAGHGVDESRLVYAAQRHTNSNSHLNGAVIVRDGFPYLLFEGVQWERLKKL